MPVGSSEWGGSGRGGWRNARHGTGWWDGKFSWAGRNLPPLVESGADIRIYEALLFPLSWACAAGCLRNKKPRKWAFRPYITGFSGAFEMVEAEGLEPTTH